MSNSFAICSYIRIKVPNYPILENRNRNNNFNGWPGAYEYIQQAKSKDAQRIFPTFNNGLIIIRNELARDIGRTWKKYRKLYREYIREKEGLDIKEGGGQDTIGLSINAVCPDWEPLKPGFHLLITPATEEANMKLEREKCKFIFAHYSKCGKESFKYETIKAEIAEARKNYYRYNSKY